MHRVPKNMENSVSSDRTKKEKRVHPFPKGIVYQAFGKDRGLLKPRIYALKPN